MSFKRKSGGVGCLYIGDFAAGFPDGTSRDWSCGIPDVEMHVFRCTQTRGLWEQLQFALQDARAGSQVCAVMAVGTGCAAALALACQLPVERIVLVDPVPPVRRLSGLSLHEARPEVDGLQRTLRRLAAFARRNLALCVSDILLVGEGGSSLERAFGRPVNCRVSRVPSQGRTAKELYTICEFAVKEAISGFVHTTQTPKPLAEISEMCIIYG